MWMELVSLDSFVILKSCLRSFSRDIFHRSWWSYLYKFEFELYLQIWIIYAKMIPVWNSTCNISIIKPMWSMAFWQIREIPAQDQPIQLGTKKCTCWESAFLGPKYWHSYFYQICIYIFLIKQTVCGSICRSLKWFFPKCTFWGPNWIGWSCGSMFLIHHRSARLINTMCNFFMSFVFHYGTNKQPKKESENKQNIEK